MSMDEDATDDMLRRISEQAEQEFVNIWSGSYTTSSDQPLTLATLEEAYETVERLRNEVQDVLVAYMISMGFDPAEGGRLLLPMEEFKAIDFGPLGPPLYVKGSDMITEAMFVRANAFEGFYGP